MPPVIDAVAHHPSISLSTWEQAGRNSPFLCDVEHYLRRVTLRRFTLKNHSSLPSRSREGYVRFMQEYMPLHKLIQHASSKFSILHSQGTPTSRPTLQESHIC